ncbi:MAG: hypothetical protein CMO74_07010 [Verrucomicrobiales bacterium]|nr:hypothetical protein [Verrucomicrobiales bacterium]
MRDWISAMPASGLEPVASAQADTLKAFQTGKISALNTLLAKPENAALLADALEGEDPEQLNIRAARTEAAQIRDPNISDLFLRYQTHLMMSDKIGFTPNPSKILVVQGDAGRGRQLFWRADLLCLNCHRAEGKGRDFGPDLTGLGRRHNRGQILDQILRPSKHIHPEYVLQLVELKKGEPVSGFVRHRDKEGIFLRDAALKEHQIPFTNIKSIRPSKLSAMPVGIIQNLTAQEAADLVEYLRSLR